MIEILLTAPGLPVAVKVSCCVTPVTDATTALVPRTRYNVDVETVRPHHVSHQTLSVQTTDAVHHLAATISPGDSATVGVGTPVVVTLDGDVAKAKRAGVESRLSVTTSPPVAGAWHWMSARELHWRPPTYWLPHTDVNVEMNYWPADVANLGECFQPFADWIDSIRAVRIEATNM